MTIRLGLNFTTHSKLKPHKFLIALKVNIKITHTGNTVNGHTMQVETNYLSSNAVGFHVKMSKCPYASVFCYGDESVDDKS